MRDLGSIPGLGRFLEKEMATHSNTLALKIPWREELGAGCYLWGRKELGTTEGLHFLSFLRSQNAALVKLMEVSELKNREGI